MAEEILDEEIASNPHREVIGHACMALAERLIDNAGVIRDRNPPGENWERLIDALFAEEVAPPEASR